ncbi:MAG TPA: chorismate-binding protein [Candidatus Ruania gallistercoris]|uniref:Chorismate-binding protein n=1 Tax=Candidatus Ruania gallistercoris TaxID=2838746 RepID=A0A9D2EB37_9MICO|nr:chorismate-binding protein [Candidatus Ruania gallistercoris]
MSQSASRPKPPHPGVASFAGVQATEVCDYADLTRSPHALRAGGWWAIAGEFDGPVHAWRFARVQARPADDGAAHRWRGPSPGLWSSSMDQAGYVTAVRATQDAIREGEVYQANICRMLSAPLPERPDAAALAAVLTRGNPAPFAGHLDIPDGSAWPSAWVVSASPELSFAVEDGTIRSGPIKGTGRTPADLQAKDRAENVMITDLVRNDLQRICAPGTVTVTELLATETHPGLVHLVSRVRGALARSPVAWEQVLGALHPPGSTSGAPKSSALRLIRLLESAPRGLYCGQFGWIDADTGTARVGVAIRTFTWAEGRLAFGSGAGITSGSEPEAEWAETELKAARLVALASTPGGPQVRSVL